MDRVLYLTLRILLKSASCNERKVVMSILHGVARDAIDPPQLVCFLNTFFTKDVVTKAVARSERIDKLYTATLAKKRVAISFTSCNPTRRACTECLSHVATQTLPSCKHNHISVCYDCLDEDSKEQQCIYCAEE